MMELMPDADSFEAPLPLVHPPRHPAEELTGARFQVTETEAAIVHMPLPREVAPSLAHLAVAIDTAAGQAAGRRLTGPDTALRTLSLNLQLAADLASGTWVAAHGSIRAQQGQSLLTSCEVFDDQGVLLALGTGRFMIVDVPRSRRPAVPPIALDRSVIPSSWDPALGLGDPAPEAGGTAQNMVTTRSAAPSPATDNAASMVHGGVQVRALELAMHSALEAAGADAERADSPAEAGSAPGLGRLAVGPVLSDVAVVFHRPVPLGDDGGVQARSSVRRKGRRVTIAEASLVNRDHKLLCTAEGIFTPAPSVP